MQNIELIQGDITEAVVDAIVNAANPGMLGGGGVDGAIHRAAGPDLLVACKEVEARHGIRCPTGEARITRAGQLASKYVIHTVGPVYHQVPNPVLLLTNAYRNSLKLALEYECKSVAFPAISCGVYGYPMQEAAEVALKVCAEADFSEIEISFYLFDKNAMEIWSKVKQELE